MADDSFLTDQLDQIKAAITAWRAAQIAFATGNAQSYTIDTGQTKQTVTRADIDKIQSTIDRLMNEYTTLCARLNGSGVTTGVPIW